MKLGYLRVSTDAQSVALQRDALAPLCDRMWTEQASGALAHSDRPALRDLLSHARAGDQVICYSLSRLGRSTADLLAIAEDCQERGIELLFLSEQLDTTTPAGRLIFTVFAALAAFEREQLVERTRAGMEAARVRGSQMGRPSVMPPERLAAAQRLAADGVPVAAIARSLGVSRATVYRHLRDGQAA